jgi:serine/threonine-protein kinase
MAGDDAAATAPQLDPTHAPSSTIRAQAPFGAPPTLPTISVDLRAAMEGAAPSGSDLEVLSVLGEGGMGRVLLARQRSLSRDVAVKTALPGASPGTHAALLAEGSIAGSLEHPAIVPVHALGLDAGGLPVLVMKRVEGVTWDGLLADPAHPGWEGWDGDAKDRLPGHLQILLAVCHALHFAHSRGVVHRDVKPQNVLIGRFGDAYLADWGVATRLGASPAGLCGTPAFLAPEMAQGGVVDARTDVYLLGATLHLVLTGQPRHGGATTAEVLEHARRSPPATYPPTVPEELADLANRACHVERLRRPESARAFREELVRYVRHREARALAEQAAQRVARLEPLLALAEPDAAQRAQAERLLSEARFGLEQSLAQYPENRRAQEALARVEALTAARLQRALALEREARERDPQRNARWRVVGTGLMALVTALVVAGAHAWGEENITPLSLLVLPLVAGGVIAAIGYAFARQLLMNRFDRDLFASVLLGIAALVASRLVGLVDGSTPAELVVRDSLTQASVMAVCAVAYLRWLAAVSAVFLAGAVACALAPAHAVVLFGWSTVAALAIATGAAWVAARKLRG